MSWRRLVAGALGYLLGLLPTAQIVGRMATGGRVDVTTAGTGNPGAANVTQVVGRRAGTLVLLGDAGKGVIAGILGRALAGPAGAHVGSTAALVAHCYPVTRRGRGGKGVASSVGQLLVSFPAGLPVEVAVAAAAFYAPPLERDVHRATTVAGVTWLACSLLWWWRGWSNLWGPRPSRGLPLAAAVSSGTVLLRFHQTRVA